MHGVQGRCRKQLGDRPVQLTCSESADSCSCHDDKAAFVNILRLGPVCHIHRNFSRQHGQHSQETSSRAGPPAAAAACEGPSARSFGGRLTSRSSSRVMPLCCRCSTSFRDGMLEYLHKHIHSDHAMLMRGNQAPSIAHRFMSLHSCRRLADVSSIPDPGPARSQHCHKISLLSFLRQAISQTSSWRRSLLRHLKTNPRPLRPSSLTRLIVCHLDVAVLVQMQLQMWALKNNTEVVVMHVGRAASCSRRGCMLRRTCCASMS